jgi:hypothetical protein
VTLVTLKSARHEGIRDPSNEEAFESTVKEAKGAGESRAKAAPQVLELKVDKPESYA